MIEVQQYTKADLARNLSVKPSWVAGRLARLRLEPSGHRHNAPLYPSSVLDRLRRERDAVAATLWDAASAA